MTNIARLADIRRSNVTLTREERVKFFLWARDQAIDALFAAAAIERATTIPSLPHKQEALAMLEVARHLFPLEKHGDSISIEDIINGREPE